MYVVPMPGAVAKLLDWLQFINLSLLDLGLPLQCVGLHTFEVQLAAMMLAPLGAAIIIQLGFLVRVLVTSPPSLASGCTAVSSRRCQQLTLAFLDFRAFPPWPSSL